jgi:hypothetical protein
MKISLGIDLGKFQSETFLVHLAGGITEKLRFARKHLYHCTR